MKTVLKTETGASCTLMLGLGEFLSRASAIFLSFGSFWSLKSVLTNFHPKKGHSIL